MIVRPPLNLIFMFCARSGRMRVYGFFLEEESMLHGTAVGLVGTVMAFHHGLGNPDVGRGAAMIFVSEKLVSSCYSDDTPDACAARVRGKAGDAMEKLHKLNALDGNFEADFWQADDDCSRVLIDIELAVKSELVGDSAKIRLKAVRNGLIREWMAKAKEGVDAKKLDPEILGSADKVASTD